MKDTLKANSLFCSDSLDVKGVLPIGRSNLISRRYGCTSRDASSVIACGEAFFNQSGTSMSRVYFLQSNRLSFRRVPCNSLWFSRLVSCCVIPVTGVNRCRCGWGCLSGRVVNEWRSFLLLVPCSVVYVAGKMLLKVLDKLHWFLKTGALNRDSIVKVCIQERKIRRH